MSDKKFLFEAIDAQRAELCSMADQIFDNPEYEGEEVFASGLLTDYLKKNGFEVEMGVGGFKTAFRAAYSHGEGGPVLGILCEYDALRNLGHGCGHHMQGPGCLGAAVALKNLDTDKPFQLVVYGTPAEETFGSKVQMIQNGCFRELDVAFMMHGGPNTCTDIKCLAQKSYKVTFHGHRAHAALAPEKGRSAFDAMLAAFQGIEFLREHVKEDSRMHYTVLDAGGPSNIVPGRTRAEYTLRSYSTDYLENVIVPRFYDIIKGACLMTGTTYDIERSYPFKAKIPCITLNDLIMENAGQFDAPQITGPREKTGSTDFGNVMYDVPGCCIRTAFVPEGTSAHSKEYLDAGKTDKAHAALRSGSEILAATCVDILENPELLQKIKEEFQERKKKEQLMK